VASKPAPAARPVRRPAADVRPDRLTAMGRVRTFRPTTATAARVGKHALLVSSVVTVRAATPRRTPAIAGPAARLVRRVNLVVPASAGRPAPPARRPASVAARTCKTTMPTAVLADWFVPSTTAAA